MGNRKDYMKMLQREQYDRHFIYPKLFFDMLTDGAMAITAAVVVIRFVSTSGTGDSNSPKCCSFAIGNIADDFLMLKRWVSQSNIFMSVRSEAVSDGILDWGTLNIALRHGSDNGL